MKRFVISMLAIILIVSLAAHASAITTGQWDFEAGNRHAQKVAQEALAAQQTTEATTQPTEPAEELPKDTAPTEPDWQGWLSRWLEWLDTVRN